MDVGKSRHIAEKGQFLELDLSGKLTLIFIKMLFSDYGITILEIGPISIPQDRFYGPKFQSYIIFGLWPVFKVTEIRRIEVQLARLKLDLYDLSEAFVTRFRQTETRLTSARVHAYAPGRCCDADPSQKTGTIEI